MEAWAISGIRNVSKMVLQNRPNVKAVMLDTQVYSNTGGQNSDSTPMLGGSDMNSFWGGHPGEGGREEDRGRDVSGRSRISVRRRRFRLPTRRSSSGRFMDALEYRGTGVSCSASRRVSRNMASGTTWPSTRLSASERLEGRARSSSSILELGETYQRGAGPQGQPVNRTRTGIVTKFKSTGEKYRYTVAHWCATEARFRNHVKRIKKEGGGQGP